MKTIENFGAWVSGRGWWFMVVVLALWGAVFYIDQPKTVTIDAKHFACTDTEAVGIEADCTQYTKIKGVR
jgi:hypothetical protein